MGIERTITLWYLHRQLLLQELASLEAQLVQIYTASEGEAAQPEVGKSVSPLTNAFPLDSLGFGMYTFPVGRRQESMSFLDPLEGTETNEYVEIEKQCKRVQARLHDLGPCPRPMMG